MVLTINSKSRKGEEQVMLLKNVLDLLSSIDEGRQNIYQLSQHKELHSQEIVNISQDLDKKIIDLQKIIHKRSSFRIDTP